MVALRESTSASSAATTYWRRGLLALCALVLLQMIFALRSQQGDAGIAWLPSGTSFIDRISVAPGSPAFSVGLRTGDLVDIRLLSAPDRYRWRYWWHAGDRMRIVAKRGTQTVTAEVTAVRGHLLTWDANAAYAAGLCLVFFAAILAWRRPDIAEARVLALLLLLLDIGPMFAFNNWVTPWPRADAITNMVSQFTTNAGLALFATYAMLFARPASMLRRVLAWCSYASAAVSAIYGSLAIVVLWTATIDPAGPAFSSFPAQVVQNVLPQLLPLVCALVSVAETRGMERTRLSWATLSLGFYYAIGSFASLLFALNPSLDFRLVTLISNFAQFSAPIGLTYSLVNRRLLDIGFVINRAVVFAGVSTIVIGAFILVEWGLGGWLQEMSRTENLIVSAALAVVLGLSMRMIHSRVDRFVDYVFFRKRHDDEKAIRRFAHEAAYITDSKTLLERASLTLEMRADAEFVAIALDDGAGHFGSVGENDPAVVALRAWKDVLDLHTVQTDLHGEYAYPMLARGRLIGVLVLGSKRSGEPYAPDETEAVAQLADGVATALDLLHSNAGGERNELLAAIHALPDAIVKRMRNASAD